MKNRVIKSVCALFICCAVLLSLCACSFQFLIGAGKNKITYSDYPDTATNPELAGVGEKLFASVTGKERADFYDRYVPCLNSGEAYKALCDGEADLVIAYAPSEEDREYIRKSGVGVALSAIGYDALVFITGEKSGFGSLEKDEVKKIFTNGRYNKITGFISPGNRDINALLKEIAGADVKAAEDKVFLNGETLKAAEVYGEKKNTVKAESYLYFETVGSLKYPRSEILALSSLVPDFENIQNGDYPYVTEIYAAVREDSEESSAERMIYNFLRTEQGKEIIRP